MKKLWRGVSPRIRLAVSYILLFLTAVGFAIWYSKASADSWVRAYAPNIVTSALGILAVIFLIERIVEKAREEDRRKRVRLAGERLHRPLILHYQLLMNMLKAAADNPAAVTRPREDPTAWLDDAFVEEIRHLDFYGKSPVFPPMDWFDYVSGETNGFRSDLSQVVDTYAAVLDAEALAILEDLTNDSLMVLFEHLPITKQGGEEAGLRYAVLEGAEAIIREHANLLSRLIRLYNSIAPDNQLLPHQDLLRTDISPQVGSSRISRDDYTAIIVGKGPPPPHVP